MVLKVTPSVFYSPQYVAISEGIFEKHGVDVEIILASGGDAVMSTLISGDAQIGLMGPESSIYVYNQGLKDYAVTFAQLTQKDGAFIVGKEDADDFSLDDLKGKEILGGRAGGVPCMSLQWILEKSGLEVGMNTPVIGDSVNVRTDVEFAAMAGAFQSGQGDYTTLFEPTATQVELAGYGYVLAGVGEFTDELAYTCYSSLSSFLTDRKEDVINFTKAIQEAQDWVYSHTDEEVAISVQSFFAETDLDILISAISRYRSIEAWAKTPELTEDEFEYLQDIMINAGELTKYSSFVDLVDTSIFKSI